MLKLRKIAHKKLYVFLLSGLVVFAIVLRIALITSNWPGTNSDEATMDLMALHIAYHGAHPIFFYGQGYMGCIQAYIGALLFHIFGVSIFSVRLGLVLMYALFLIGMYYLTSLLYTRLFALYIVGLLSFGSSSLLTVQLFANGGYAETRVFGVFIALIAFWLAYTSQPLEQHRNAEQASTPATNFALWITWPLYWSGTMVRSAYSPMYPDLRAALRAVLQTRDPLTCWLSAAHWLSCRLHAYYPL